MIELLMTREMAEALQVRGRTWGERNATALRQMRRQALKHWRSPSVLIRLQDEQALRERRALGNGCFVSVRAPVLE